MGAWGGCALALVATACSFEATHGTGYKCVDDGDCPDGQRCVELMCSESDSALGDGAPGVDAPVVDAGLPNLLVNPGFESADLEDWVDYNAVVDRTMDPVRSGSYAGRVCRGDAAEYFTAYQFFLRDAVPTGTYRVSAYVRSAVDGVTLPMRVTIRESGPGGEVNHDGDELDVGDVWKKLAVDGTVTATDLEWIQIIVWGLTGDDVCYLVDDATAVQLE